MSSSPPLSKNKKLLRLFHSRFPLIAVLATLASTGQSVHATIDASLQMQLGNPSGAIVDPNNHEHYLIQRTVEAIDYNADLDEPNWASWDLTAGDIGSSGRSPDFFTDTSLPSGFYEVSPNDYSGSGYDRGHMCPSADRTDNTTDNDTVFLMSNIIPQAPENNQGVWANFENYCRSLADAGDELLIICGPSRFNGSRIQPSLAVAIPDYTWKIVVVVLPGSGTALSRITASTRVICINVPNNNSVSSTWQNYVTSASQIEVDTGFSFFTALPPDIAAALRSKVDGQSSSPPGITGFSPASGSIGSSVVITGTNFNSITAAAFGNTPALSYVVNSSTQITAVVATNTEDGPISVTAATGTGLSSNSFTVLGSIVDLTVGESHTGNFTQGDAADTYIITVSNSGNVPSSGLVTLTDVLPAGLTVTAMSGFGWTADMGSLTGTRSDTLPGGASYPPVTVTVAVSTNAPAIITNVATISGGDDANSANNTVSDPTTVFAYIPPGEVVALLAWDVHNFSGATDGFGPSPFMPTTMDSHITGSGLVRGSGIGTNGTAANRAWGGVAFTGSTESTAVAASQFVSFSASANAGYTVSYTAISEFDYRHSTTGPSSGVLQYQVGSGPFVDITSLSYPVNTSGGASLSPISLSGISDLQNVGAGTNVTFRIVNYGGGPAGTWYVFDVANSTAPDFVVQGSISPVVALTPIESWRQQWFGTTNNSGLAADSAVDTSDGMPNLLKYAFGLNPLVPEASPIVGDISTGYLRISVPKNPDATDVTFLVETTDSLSDPWSTDGIIIDQNTPTFLQAHFASPVGSANSCFMRVRINQP